MGLEVLRLTWQMLLKEVGIGKGRNIVDYLDLSSIKLFSTFKAKGGFACKLVAKETFSVLIISEGIVRKA